jgi:hypothetical protein
MKSRCEGFLDKRTYYLLNTISGELADGKRQKERCRNTSKLQRLTEAKIRMFSCANKIRGGQVSLRTDRLTDAYCAWWLLVPAENYRMVFLVSLPTPAY